MAKSQKWSRAENTDLKVTVFGNTAIATGTEKSKGTDASGQSVAANERWTDTWMKMPSGKWQCVASHQSRIKM
jgi:ketosteroid isomerase-like protein